MGATVPIQVLQVRVAVITRKWGDHETAVAAVFRIPDTEVNWEDWVIARRDKTQKEFEDKFVEFRDNTVWKYEVLNLTE